MPQRIETPEEVLAAMERIPLFAGVPLEARQEWLRGFIDSDGKRSGPLVHLDSYEPGETLMRENQWGGNTFMILVDGALDVFMRSKKIGDTNKVNEISPGESFGEMSLFAGVPRIASVVAVGPKPSLVLEIARQAFRGMERKAAQFIEQLGKVYELRGLGTTIEWIRQSSPGAFSQSQLDRLQKISSFKVFGRAHLLCEEGQAINKVFLISNGWVRRSRDLARVDDSIGWAKLGGESVDLDFLGSGNFVGFQGLSATTPLVWKYSSTVMLRTEVMEIDLALLRADAELCDAAQQAFARFAILDTSIDVKGLVQAPALESTEEVITTGIVEAENVLVMDMDLCIRCGNCSLACEKVHGQSRLVRRGIHIERTSQVQNQKSQHLLVPEVCIHCQDPECLTGCPTGAIARLAHGQIDIEAATCTGCSACARLCPYNAISMIQENPGSQGQPGLGCQLGSWLGLRPPILPLPVLGTKKDNLIAAKCNLCEDTPLNPVGARTPAYSCEENCPTGALVRVNPREYFDEVKERLGVVFQTPTMAVGRNIHRRDPIWWWCHLAGGLLILATLIGELLAWRNYGFDQRLGALPMTLRWLTGLFGVVAILGAMVYSWRRRKYLRRVGPLRYWMVAHVHLGVVAAVALLLHGGSHRGGPLTTILMLSFDTVLLSGLFGIISYYVSPRLLTRIEGDPILREDLEARRNELHAELAGLGKHEQSIQQLLDQARKRFGSFEYLLRQVSRREELSALLASARDEYRPLFARLGVSGDEMALLAHIEKLATLRRLDALIFLHQLMKVWLPPHIIAASLMLALLAVHVVQVLLFAVR
jgi:Fe-S-cluster-containing dehydrogenase component/CRP-like cAMP-binding protein